MRPRLRSFTSSFRARVALGYAVVVVVLAVVWAWSLYAPVTQATIDQQRSHLLTIARISALAVSQVTTSPAVEVSRVVARTDLRVTLVAADGTVLADSAHDASTMQNHAKRPEIVAALAGRTGYDTRRSATLGVDFVYVAVPATFDGQRIALRVSEPLARVEAIAGGARQTGLLLLVAALAAVVVVGYRLSASAARPLELLKDAAEAMAAGDLRAPLPKAEGELGELGEALASLRDRVRDTIGELEGGQATLRAVLDGLPDAVFVFEREEVTIANRAAERIFRAPVDGWNGCSLGDLDMPASLAAAIRARLGSEAPLSGEVGPDPQARYFRVTAMPISPAGTATRTLVVVSDVTERRRLDQVRRDFVANASHELKTPASAIQLLADAADTAVKDDDPEQALAFVAQMKSEADRLRRLVLDLLDLSRLETVPQPGSITDLRVAVSNALTGHRAPAAAAGLRLELDDAAVAGRDVYAAAEPTDVAVALDNMLANAIAYTESGGVTVSLDEDESTIVVKVRDTGIGIAPEHLPRVFERFYRVEAARTRAGGGTGLGLALVRNAAERSGGSVDISSTPGKGTAVALRLPRAR
jgi:two-component system, OmpR family, phosphate regulon sensor histidine kinase PhoR